MDNTPATNDESEADGRSPRAAVPMPMRSSGMKVIQPLSPDLQPDEPAAAAPVEASQPQAVSPPVADTPAPARTNPLMNSIYPTATHGVGAMAHPFGPAAPEGGEATSDSSKTTVISIVVTAFGALIVVVSALSLLAWINFLHVAGASSIIGMLLAAGELALGIGIILKREAARATYVFLSVILLIFSLFGTYNYLHNIQKLQKLQQAFSITTEQQIAVYNNNKNLSDAQRSQLIKNVQDSQKRGVKSTTAYLLWPLIGGYAISVLPLIFLTRRSVKAIFS